MIFFFWCIPHIYTNMSTSHIQRETEEREKKFQKVIEIINIWHNYMEK